MKERVPILRFIGITAASVTAAAVIILLFLILGRVDDSGVPGGAQPPGPPDLTADLPSITILTDVSRPSCTVQDDLGRIVSLLGSARIDRKLLGTVETRELIDKHGVTELNAYVICGVSEGDLRSAGWGYQISPRGPACYVLYGSSGDSCHVLEAHETADDRRVGAAYPLVTITGFMDYQCPACRDLEGALRQILDRNGDTAAFVFRNFPVSRLHPLAQKAAEAAECGRLQGRFWDVHDAIYLNQAGLSEEFFVEMPRVLKMDEVAFGKCLADEQVKAEVDRDLNAGLKLGVCRTPTIFIGTHRVVGARPIEFYQEIVDEELRASRSPLGGTVPPVPLTERP